MLEAACVEEVLAGLGEMTVEASLVADEWKMYEDLKTPELRRWAHRGRPLLVARKGFQRLRSFSALFFDRAAGSTLPGAFSYWASG